MTNAVTWHTFAVTVIGAVLMASVTAGPTTTASPKCDGQADIVFILDASGSIESTNYDLMKQFLSNVVDQFTVGPTAIRFSAIVFSSTTSLEFTLNRYTTSADVKQAILALPYESSLTYTGKALKLAREEAFSALNGARSGVPKLAVVLTDGVSSDASDTRSEAALLKSSGVTVLVVGIGSGVNTAELDIIASSPSLVSTVTNFVVLETIKAQLVQIACEEKQKLESQTSCIVSSCVGKPDGNYPACDEVCRQGYYYTCSNENAHKMPCGLGWYVRSDGSRFTAPMVYNPSTYTCDLQADYCPRDPVDYVTSAGYTSARTTPSPIKSCITNNCKNKTDGNYPACVPECQEGYYYSCVNQYAYKMPCALGWYLDSRNQWYTAKMVYNPATDSCELTSASCPRYVTETTTAAQVVCTGGKADALFILDSSGSITEPNWQLILGFAANLTKQFTVGVNDVLFSAISFSNSAVREFSFTTHLTKSALEQGLLRLSYLGGGTDTADALREARTYSFTSANGARSNVQRVAIVITDGLSNDPPATATEASSLKLTGATVIAIGVGSNVGVSELQSMASSSNLVLQVNDFNALATIEDVLVKSVCQS